MAIFKDIEAAVVVEGRDLAEYQDDEGSTTDTITKYVEVVSGASFSVRYKHSQQFLKNHKSCGVQYKVEIDGKSVGKTVLHGGALSGSTSVKYSEVRGQQMQQEFRFSNLEIGKTSLA